jgi:hypothetical protein
LKSVGLVKSEDFDPNFFPGYLKWVIWAAIKLVGVSPDEYAYYPVYVREFSYLFSFSLPINPSLITGIDLRRSSPRPTPSAPSGLEDTSGAALTPPSWASGPRIPRTDR